jgi:hypothetical protein
MAVSGGGGMATKGGGIPAAADVRLIFSDQRVREMIAAEKKLSSLFSDDGLRQFAASIRAAARVYIRDVDVVSHVDIRREIEALYRAIVLADCIKAAELVANMAKQTRTFLNKRAVKVGLKISKPSAFRDRSRCRAACETLRQLLSQGGHLDNGKWVPHLYLPRRQFVFEVGVQDLIRRWVKTAEKRGISVNMEELTRKALINIKGKGFAPKLRPPKRQAVRTLIRDIQVAFLKTTGKKPPLWATKSDSRPRVAETADPVAGPFARFVQRCVDLLGTDKSVAIDAIGQMNELERRRAALRKKQQNANK